MIELQKHGFICLQQAPIDIYYENIKVGNYFSDIPVDNCIIPGLKALDTEIIPEHERQLLYYLKATDIELGLIFNFGKTPSFKRKIFSNVLPK